MMSQPPPPPKTPSPTMKIKKEPGIAVKHDAEADSELANEEPVKKKLRPSRPLKNRNKPFASPKVAESSIEEKQVKLKMGAVTSPEKIVESSGAVTNRHQESVNEELRSVISMKQKMIEELQEQFLLVQSENLYKTSELTDLQERLSSLEAENERLGNGGGEWNRLQEKVKNLMRDKENMKDLQIKVKRLEKENESNKNGKEVKDLEIKMKVLEKENQSLEGKIKNFEKELESSRNSKNNDQLENKIKILEKENRTLATSVSSHINSAGELLRTVVSLKSKVEEVKVGESRQVKTLKRMVFNLETEKRNLKKVIELQKLKSKKQSHMACHRKIKELMIERMNLFENLTEENEKVVDLENRLRKAEKSKTSNNNNELQKELKKAEEKCEDDNLVLEERIKDLESENRKQRVELEKLNEIKMKLSDLEMEKLKVKEAKRLLSEDSQDLSFKKKESLNASNESDELEKINKSPKISLGEEEVRRLLFSPSVDDLEKENPREQSVEDTYEKEDNKEDVDEENKVSEEEEKKDEREGAEEVIPDANMEDMEEPDLEEESKDEHDDMEIESIENIKKLVEKQEDKTIPSPRRLQDFLEKIRDSKTREGDPSIFPNAKKSFCPEPKDSNPKKDESPFKNENIGVQSFEKLVSSWTTNILQMGSSSNNILKSEISKIIDCDKELTETNAKVNYQKKVPVSFVGDLSDNIKELKDIPVLDNNTKESERVGPSHCDKCGIDLKESEECFEGECSKISEYTRDFLEILCDYCGAREDHWAEACALVTSFCEVCHCWGHRGETHDDEDQKLEGLLHNYNQCRTKHYASKQLPENSRDVEGNFKFAGTLEDARALLSIL